MPMRMMSDYSDDRQTHFGFQSVGEVEKKEKVLEVFHNVADSYDVMNDVMSAGVHRVWKDHFVRKLRPSTDMTLLDVAGGTGDIAFRYLDRGGGAVTVCDINQSMLRVGEERASSRGYSSDKITWVEGDAQVTLVLELSSSQYPVPGSPLPRQQLRLLHHRLRDTKCRPDRLRSPGSLQGGEARGSISLSGVQLSDSASAGLSIRPLLLPSDPSPGSRHSRGLAQLPVLGGEYPPVSGPADLRWPHQRGWLEVC